MGERGELGAQHLMRAQGRHLFFEGVSSVEPARAHVTHDIVVDVLEIAEVLVEMPGQQQRGVAEVALGHFERALAEF
jgi:hypothetical protein